MLTFCLLLLFLFLFLFFFPFFPPFEKGAYWSPWLVGMGAEEANCMLSLTASGLLHRFPTLKILMTHGGGGFPALKGRIEQGIRCRRQWVWPGELCVSVFFCVLQSLFLALSIPLYHQIIIYIHVNLTYTVLTLFIETLFSVLFFLNKTSLLELGFQFLVIIMKRWV